MPENVTSNHDRQNSVQDTEVAHIAGVFDAVGNVTIRVKKDSDYKLGYQLQPMVEIARSNDDDPVLGKILEYCDEQNVRYSINEKSHGPNREGSSIKITIKRTESIKAFLEPLQEFLVTKYFDVQLMLNEVIPAVEADDHLIKEGFYQLVGIAEELRKDSSKGTGSKYTQEFFEEEWSITQ